MQWVGVCYFLFILWWQLLCCSGSISCMWRCSAGWVSGVLPQHCSTKVTAVRTFVLQCCGSTSIMLQYEGHGSSYLHTAVLWKCFHEVAVRRSQQFVPSYFHEVAVWRSQQFVPSYCSVVEVLPWRCSTKVTAVRSLATILQANLHYPECLRGTHRNNFTDIRFHWKHWIGFLPEELLLHTYCWVQLASAISGQKWVFFLPWIGGLVAALFCGFVQTPAAFSATQFEAVWIM